MQSRGRMDLVHDYALPIPTTVIAEMLGVPVKYRHKFHRWSSAIVSSNSSRWGTIRAIPNVMAFVRYIRKLIKQKRSNPKDDLLTALVRAEEAGDQFSDDELLAMVFLLLVAGHETTVNLIANGVSTLLENPDHAERPFWAIGGRFLIQAEYSYLLPCCSSPALCTAARSHLPFRLIQTRVKRRFQRLPCGEATQVCPAGLAPMPFSARLPITTAVSPMFSRKLTNSIFKVQGGGRSVPIREALTSSLPSPRRSATHARPNLRPEAASGTG
jgi:hypothetical protein